MHHNWYKEVCFISCCPGFSLSLFFLTSGHSFLGKTKCFLRVDPFLCRMTRKAVLGKGLVNLFRLMGSSNCFSKISADLCLYGGAWTCPQSINQMHLILAAPGCFLVSSVFWRQFTQTCSLQRICRMFIKSLFVSSFSFPRNMVFVRSSSGGNG